MQPDHPGFPRLNGKCIQYRRQSGKWGRSYLPIILANRNTPFQPAEKMGIFKSCFYMKNKFYLIGSDHNFYTIFLFYRYNLTNITENVNLFYQLSLRYLLRITSKKYKFSPEILVWLYHWHCQFGSAVPAWIHFG